MSAIELRVPADDLAALGDAGQARLRERVTALASAYAPADADVAAPAIALVAHELPCVAVRAGDRVRGAAIPPDPADVDAWVRTAIRLIAMIDRVDRRWTRAWADVTVHVDPAAAEAPLDEIGLTGALWRALGVPLPPLVRAADAALAPGEVRIAVGGRMATAITIAPTPTQAIYEALVDAAPCWLDPDVVATLFALTVPLDALERLRRVVPADVLGRLVARLVAERLPVRALGVVTEACVAGVFDVTLAHGADVTERDEASLLGGLEVASRLALRRMVSWGLVTEGRTDVVQLAPAALAALVAPDASFAVHARLLARLGAGGPTQVLAVPALARRAVRDRLDGWFARTVVVALEELVASDRFRLATVLPG